MMTLMMTLLVCVMLRLAGERGDVARNCGLPPPGTWSNTHASPSSRGGDDDDDVDDDDVDA